MNSSPLPSPKVPSPKVPSQNNSNNSGNNSNSNGNNGSSSSNTRILQILCCILLLFIIYLWKEKDASQAKTTKISSTSSHKIQSKRASPQNSEEPFSHNYQARVNKYLKAFMKQESLKQKLGEIRLRQQLPLVSELAQDREAEEVKLPIGGKAVSPAEENLYRDIEAENKDFTESKSNLKQEYSYQNIQDTTDFQQWQKGLREGQKKHIHQWLLEKAKEEGYRIRLNKNFKITTIQAVNPQRQPSSPNGSKGSR